MITDLTKGAPAKVLVSFTLPILLSSIFQQFYNMADSIIAGNFISDAALSAIGASYPITMIYIAIALGASIGCSVLISQYFGAKRYNDMKSAINTSFVSTIVLGIILIIISVVFCKPVLELLNTPQDIIEDSKIYLDVYIYGILFLMLYNTCTAVFTALGDSKTPLYFLIASSIGNIMLNLTFVIVFEMGVAGIAWATFVAQGIASLLALMVLIKKLKKTNTDTQQSEKIALFDFTMFKKISLIAVPSILQQSFISVGNLLIQGVINGYGSSVIAGFSSGMKINVFSVMSISALANGLSSFTAQNIGAGKVQRVKKGFKAGVIIGLSLSVVFGVTNLLFGREILSVFLTGDDKLAMDTGLAFIYIVSMFFPVICIKLMIDGVLRGGGAMKAFMIATFTDLIIRVILAYVLSGQFGAIGIWASWPIGWTVAMVVSIVFYVKGVWNKKRI